MLKSILVRRTKRPKARLQCCRTPRNRSVFIIFLEINKIPLCTPIWKSFPKNILWLLFVQFLIYVPEKHFVRSKTIDTIQFQIFPRPKIGIWNWKANVIFLLAPLLQLHWYKLIERFIFKILLPGLRTFYKDKGSGTFKIKAYSSWTIKKL